LRIRNFLSERPASSKNSTEASSGDWKRKTRRGSPPTLIAAYRISGRSAPASSS
jgi:hypothetical protein